MKEQDDYGLIDGETCNRNGCKGIMKEVDSDSCCSCHIFAPCEYCVNKEFECSECGYIVEPPSHDGWGFTKTTYKPERTKSKEEIYNELPDGEFGYILIAGKYYWMEAKGKCPEGMTSADILAKFNTCFGYEWIKAPLNGTFHLKYYTD